MADRHMLYISMQIESGCHMDCIHIHGGKPLEGEAAVQGSKNGALVLVTATVLIKGQTVLYNCPQITDMDEMLGLLKTLGCRVKREGAAVIIDASSLHTSDCPAKQVRAMRSSVMLLGPLLGRCGNVSMERPGGCMIGKRPVDIHETALTCMGVRFRKDEKQILAETEGLKGAEICLPFPSVGATENVLMAAVLAEGTTVLYNAAQEPEITQLCHFLNEAGAKITGVGTNCLTISGVGKLQPVTFTVMPDRIVAGTYLLAGAATRGIVTVKNAPVRQLTSLLDVLRKMGAVVRYGENAVVLDAARAGKPVPYLRTAVYPGFPTDLQSMLAAVLTRAEGSSAIEETIFEDRFKIVRELQKMGADLKVENNRKLRIYGVTKLYPARLTACELRGGAALVVAALMAEGESKITGCDYIRRGYEDICRDLRLLGADVEEKRE